MTSVKSWVQAPAVGDEAIDVDEWIDLPFLVSNGEQKHLFSIGWGPYWGPLQAVLYIYRYHTSMDPFFWLESSGIGMWYEKVVFVNFD